MDCTKAYLDDLSTVKLFTREEERELWQQVRAGKSARELLVESMLPYVVSCAKRWRKEAAKQGIPFDDLVSQGNLALLRVVDGKFDPGKGRLITILRYHIDRELRLLIGSTDKTIRTPAYLSQHREHGKKIERYGREYAAACNVGSLDGQRAIADKHLSTLSAMIACEDRKLCTKEFHAVLAVLHTLSLPPRDAQLFRDYIDCGCQQESLSKKYGITRQRVSQIVRQIIKRLRRRLNENGKADG